MNVCLNIYYKKKKKEKKLPLFFRLTAWLLCACYQPNIFCIAVSSGVFTGEMVWRIDPPLSFIFLPNYNIILYCVYRDVTEVQNKTIITTLFYNYSYKKYLKIQSMTVIRTLLTWLIYLKIFHIVYISYMAVTLILIIRVWFLFRQKLLGCSSY